MQHNRFRRDYSIEVFLPFYYLLAQYADMLWIGLGNVALLIVALLSFKRESLVRLRKTNIPFIILWLLMISKDIYRASVGGTMSPINNCLEYSVVILSVLIVCNHSLNEDILYKSWKFAGVLYCSGIVYHLVQIFVSNSLVQPISIVPGYSLGAGLLSSRPLSFFLEPAACVSALLPLIFLTIRRKKYIEAIVFSFFVAATTSSVGILLMIVLWVYEIIYTDLELKKKSILLIFLTGIGIAATSIDFIGVGVDKIVGISNGEGTFGSRVKVGFDVIKSMRLQELFLGTSEPNVYTYVSHYGYSFSDIVSVYFRSNNLFLNGLCYLVFNYGLLGLGLYLYFLLKKLRSKNYKAKAFIVLHLVSMFGQSTILNSLFFQVLILIMLYDRFEETGKGDL